MSEMMNAGVIVAGLAVIVSAIMQYMTLRTTRLNTISGLQVGMVESSLSQLQDALSEYIPVCYDMGQMFENFLTMSSRIHDLSGLDHEDEATKQEKHSLQERAKALDGKLRKLQLTEAKLLVRIELRLDKGQETHRRLLDTIMYFRDHRTGEGETWLERREKVIGCANAVIAGERKRALMNGYSP